MIAERDDAMALRRAVTRFDSDTAHVDDAHSLAAQLGVLPSIAKLLWLRGVRDGDSARVFLEPSLSGLSDPDEIPDMSRAVAMLTRAIEHARRIGSGAEVCVYGDYDVDGVTSTAMLIAMFGQLGIRVRHYIPDRLVEGYGLNGDAIRKLAGDGVRLLITVDGGSNDVDELRIAESLGVDVIVTDHHPIHVDIDELAALPIVHPGRPDRPTSSAALAGVGVVYKLVWSLGRALSGSTHVSDDYREFMLSALAYVALGTVADVVPLTGENRVLVSYGLRALSTTSHVGLRALLAEAKVEPRTVRAEEVAYRVAPLINAAGRLGDAGKAVELLLLEHDDEADTAIELAASLGADNRERKRIEREMLAQSLEQIEQLELADGRNRFGSPIVVAREGWHSGVAGIVASRLVDRYQRPVFVIAIGDGIGRGSGRTVESAPLTAFYDAARPIVESIGGHAQAGGIVIAPHRVGDLRALWKAQAGDGSILTEPPLTCDLRLALDDITPEFYRQLTTMAPFGQSNPEPRFLFEGMRLDGDLRLVGAHEEHVSMLLRQGRRRIRAIYFRGAEHARQITRHRNRLSLVAEIFLNEFRGTAKPELRVVALSEPGPAE